MLPQPFINYIPTFYKRDDKLIAFADKMDEILDYLKSDTLGLNSLIDPVKISQLLLDTLGFYLNAGILDEDSDYKKRSKIRFAIQSHKNRGLWKLDVKPKIDNVAGGDSSLFGSVGEGTWRLIGDGSQPSSYIHASLGGDGANTAWGLRLAGSGFDDWDKGIVRIDTDNNSLTTDEVDQIKLDILDSSPAYFRIYLGYVSSGVFVKYANGQIN